MSSRLALAFTPWLGEVFCELLLPLVISDWSTPTSESEQGQCPGWHQALGNCVLCQVTDIPGIRLRSKILSVSILLAATPSQEFMAQVRIFQTKQNKVNG